MTACGTDVSVWALKSSEFESVKKEGNSRESDELIEGAERCRWDCGEAGVSDIFMKFVDCEEEGKLRLDWRYGELAANGKSHS